MRDYAAEAPSRAEYFDMLAVNKRTYVFIGLDQAGCTDLHMVDLLHNINLGLFKHMLECVKAILQRHKRQQALDYAWKEIPPYLGFSIQTKAYCTM